MSISQKPFFKTFIIIFFITGNSHLLYAQDLQDNVTNKKKPLKMTSLAYGGTGVLMTGISDQFTIMTGGRGSATYNNRFTFGGGGWGMPKGVELSTSKTDTFAFCKLGYGGLEFGYIVFPGEICKAGVNILLGAGAGFRETLPKTENSGFNIFPVFEPSVYSQIKVGGLMMLDIGVKYRFITGADLPYIGKDKLSGLACYIALLGGTCK